jgi:competence protein CoiA
LLKIELASAIRGAGWDARLEVAGDGWRADVLATDPASSRLIAWEAQLSNQTADATIERTARLGASGVEVCWVTDRCPPWLGAAPSVRIAHDGTALRVVEGHARLDADWCASRRNCNDEILSERGGPCTGHGRWRTPEPVALSAFTGYILGGRVVAHLVGAGEAWSVGPWVWTAPAYLRLDAELRQATQLRENWRRQEAALREQHEQRVRALLQRQEDLRRPVMTWMMQEREKQVVVADGERGPKWAMGVPVYFGQEVLGVVCPVASRVKEVAHRLANLVVFAATDGERDRILSATTRELHVVVLGPDGANCPLAPTRQPQNVGPRGPAGTPRDSGPLDDP